MPIRPENRARYPRDWSSVIVPRIRARSGNQCEFTLENGERCAAMNGKPHPVTGSKVVLTVAHLNHVPEDCRDENLLHSCQRCHNRYDAPMRRRGIAERARAVKADKDLFV